MRRHLRYCTRVTQTIPIDSSNANVATTSFSMNDMYDPEVTHIGHQPRWYDELCGLYDRWVVLGSKITATPTCQSTSSQIVKCWMYKTDENDKGTFVLNDHMESGKCKQIMCVAGVVPGSTNQNGQTSLIMGYSARKDHLMRITRPKEEKTLWGSAGASPSDLFYVHLQSAPDNVAEAVTTAAINVTWDVVIDYTALFFDRKAVEASS